MSETILSARYHGQTVCEALHDAVEARDHDTARDIVRAAWLAGTSAVVPFRLSEMPQPGDAVGGRGE